MRPVTHNLVVALLVVVGLLLALGAVPSLLASGDPYYVTATAVDSADGVTPVNGSDLSERRFPYTFAAGAAAGDGTGRSDAYYRGPFGLKGSFTHSPFDEQGAYETQYPAAVTDEGTYVRLDNVTYRVAVVRGEP